MCVQTLVFYSCYPECDTSTYTALEQCYLFDSKKNPSAKYNDRCYGKDVGNRTVFLTSKLKQRCPTCVSDAVAERVDERYEREEREKDAERRGERGEVVRQLRMEDDEAREEMDI